MFPYAVANLFVGELNCDDYIVELFIGRHDKHGKAVYEGDRLAIENVTIEGGVYNAEVVFRHGSFVAISDTDCSYPLYDEGMEVIGNIHESKEVL